MGNKSRKYKFTLTLTSNGELPVPETVIAVKNEKEEKISGKDGKFEFALSHDDTVHIKQIPQGMSYSIEEEDLSDEGYLVSAEGDTKGTLSEDTNVTFTNTLNVSIPTSADLDMEPYLIMFFLSFGALGIFAAIKRKQKN